MVGLVTSRPRLLLNYHYTCLLCCPSRTAPTQVWRAGFDTDRAEVCAQRDRLDERRRPARWFRSTCWCLRLTELQHEHFMCSSLSPAVELLHRTLNPRYLLVSRVFHQFCKHSFSTDPAMQTQAGALSKTQSTTRYLHTATMPSPIAQAAAARTLEPHPTARTKTNSLVKLSQ